MTDKASVIIREYVDEPAETEVYATDELMEERFEQLLELYADKNPEVHGDMFMILGEMNVYKRYAFVRTSLEEV